MWLQWYQCSSLNNQSHADLDLIQEVTMTSGKQKRVSIFDTMVLTGVGIGIVYWIIETAYNVFTVDGAGFLDSLFGGGLPGIGTRVIVICLFIVFGAHAQYNINKRRQAESELADLKAKIKNLKSDPS
jgi:hypothetical protein